MIKDLLENEDNLTNYPLESGALPDPFKTMAVRKFENSRRFFGKEFISKTDVFYRSYIVLCYKDCMQDNQIMSYMVELQKWIQKYFWSQTHKEINPHMRQKLS